MFRKIIISTMLLMAGMSVAASAQKPSDQRIPGQGIELIQLSPLNTVVFRGTVSDASVIMAIKDLAKLDAIRGLASYPIYLVLDSGGGSIDSGLDFINFAKTVRNVKTISLFAASMASAIVEQLPGERLILGTSTLMFHRAATQISGYVETGEVESALEYTKQMVLDLEMKNASRIGLSIEQYKAKVVGEWWIYGAHNLTANTADRIVNIICTKALLELTKYGYSQCPLLRSSVGE